MKVLLTTLGVLLLLFNAEAQQQKFDNFSARFVSGYQSLNIPQLELSYVAGLQHIGSAGHVAEEVDFFNAIKAQLPAYKRAGLTTVQKLDYDLIKYETALNLERLALEKQWLKDAPEEIPAGGLLTLPNGKAWYTYLLKRWVGDEVTPDQIYAFGLTEVERVKSHIEAIRKQTGLNEDDFYKHLTDPSFFITDEATIKEAFEKDKVIINTQLHNLFNQTDITDLKIAKGTNVALVQAPGYYTDNTFYYNLTDKPYNKRQVDWLFIHEGIPGHHYQNSVTTLKSSAVQRLFFYYGFAEGWGAYAEELGKDIGLYKTPYDELGKWEWDIVRSVRVPLDVGLNYYGWTDEQALVFWKKNIRGQDDIAMREINRIRRWPAQVVTYKYGALQIVHWKEELQKKQGDKFNIKDFHTRALQHGSLPLFIIKDYVLNG
ncbi:DUF885 domain-containing protein [Mucilaginibacter sp. UYCu711]|uniref:DUF885 domain-containing protein n=1 Tax=Mucilaginibacter sp. UYCu711 TaxID=3156339 RepID=UPI003D258AA9